MRQTAVLAAALVALAGLGGCDQAPNETIGGPPAAATARSEESLQLQAYYASMQTRLQAQGLMRTDGGGPDVPFTKAALVKNFEQIALYDEYAVRNGHFVAQKTPSHLRRWQRPIRIGLVFGANVPAAQRDKDRKNVSSYAHRLARLTGANITVTDQNPNFHVLFMYNNEVKSSGPTLRRLVPNLSNIVVNEVVNIPRSTFCVAYAFSDQKNTSSYTSALILVKAEHTDLMRLGCIHEEMAQALGLANDSPTARPSIFNDDEEFALLTHQDELMLKMLYDPRLKVGMTPQAARPLLPLIATDVMRGNS